MMPIKVFVPGETLRLRDPIVKLEPGAPPAKSVEVQVVRQFPHHVLVKSRKGTRWCVTNAEIMTVMANGRLYDKHGKLICAE